MTRSALRSGLLGLGGATAGVAVVLALTGWLAIAVWLAVAGLLLSLGLLIESWRYKPLAERPPGPDWQQTGERFVDPESGKLVTVYFHPATGERRYITV